MKLNCTNPDCVEAARAKHLYWRFDDRDRVFEILVRDTFQVLARIPCDDDFPESQFDAILLMWALDRFFDRGGWFSSTFRHQTHWPWNANNPVSRADPAVSASREKD